MLGLDRVVIAGGVLVWSGSSFPWHRFGRNVLLIPVSAPDVLEGEAPKLHPDAVVCSRITPALRTTTGRWMEVRLEGGTLRVRTSDAGRSHDPNPGLDVLLQFVDRSEEQIRNAARTQEPPSEARKPTWRERDKRYKAIS